MQLPPIKPFDIYQELFFRNEFDFIVTHNIEGVKKSHERQREALNYIVDTTTEELTYGGGAGGAKSWTGCVWMLLYCSRFPGVKGFIARNSLKKLTESTLLTFFKVAKEYRFEDFHFNQQKSVILFKNGSRIDLLNTEYQPSQTYEMRFGSLEYTFGWLEEASEQHFDAYDTLKTRIGRHKNKEYGIKPLLLLTCNPAKVWTYNRIYKLAKENKLPTDRKFLKSLVDDNPFIDPAYIGQLNKIEDPTKLKRLKFGLWEYGDEENALYGTYENILSVFDRSDIKPELIKEIYSNGIKRLTADVARQGSDKAVIFVFASLNGIDYVINKAIFDKSKLTEIQKAINDFRKTYSIDKKQAIADEDGVGGGVVDNCEIKGFINNATPVMENTGTGKLPKYKNLQTQCGYKLGQRIANGKLKFLVEVSPVMQEEVIEELEQLRIANVEDDNYYYIKSKADIKADIGRSPDFRDALLMNEYFHLKPTRTLTISDY
jgi:phage terminase large subunit